MAKKANQSDTATWRRDKASADQGQIGAAIDALTGVPGANAAVEILTRLKAYAGQRWLRLEQSQYAFGDELYSNRRWRNEKQEVLPPGTTFLGIVLEKTLEVSVVEAIDENRKYHRPMTILPRGALFGTFETADLMCQTPAIQNYTLFSGLRTFFFCDTKFDNEVTGNTSYHTQIRDYAVDKTSFDKFKNNDFSSTQRPLFLLQAFLGEKSKDWKSKVLVIPVGSEFLANVPDDLKQVICCNAWSQSAHLRRQAIESYSTDRLVQVLRGPATHGSGQKAVPGEYRPAIARELKTLPALLMESRPGFRALAASLQTNDFGPFHNFFGAIELKRKERQPLSKGDEKKAWDQTICQEIYLPQFLYDEKPDLIFPLWPNFDPLCGTASDHAGPGEVLKKVEPYWSELEKELLSGDWTYSKDRVQLTLDAGNQEKSVCILRGPVRFQNKAPRLPLLEQDVVPRLAAGSQFAALIGVQHLMEETLCLVQELLTRGLVEAQNVWLLGKPYSSSDRVVRRLEQLGVKAAIPNCASWPPGEFDAYFEAAVSSFLKKALAGLPNGNSKPVALLDDGGALIKAAKLEKTPGGFRGVEQTSRGIASAIGAKFPVVLVACSGLKSLVEPEFVARAAVNKIAKYYPEALRAAKVGIIGLGNLGSYFADYIIRRHDIHHGVNVFGYDRHPESRPTSAGNFQRCDNTKAVFQEADVVYGCSGEDIGSDAQKSGRSGQLLISLSSGDIEFATLLKAAKTVSGPVVANRGFPITFDGSPSSAPLIEMQVTRALLLAGIQQALSETVPGPCPLNAQGQWNIWERWRDHALDPSKGEPTLKSWREQRHAELSDTELVQVVLRVGAEEKFPAANDQFFQKAKARFPKSGNTAHRSDTDRVDAKRPKIRAGRSNR